MWDKAFDQTDRKKFLHLIDYIIESIDTGKLESGQMLPTQRELSKKLNLSIGTITKAFKELEKMGYLTGEVGRGTYVKDISSEYEDFWYNEGKVPYRYNLGHYRSTELFNHTIQLNILSGIKEVHQQANFHLQLNDLYNCGTDEQKIDFIHWLSSLGFASVGLQNISLLTTAFFSTHLFIQALSQPGEYILLESLADPVIKDQIYQSHRKLAAVDADDKGITPDHLEAQIVNCKPKMLFTQAICQNPTGRTTPLTRKQEIMQVCQKHRVPIIELGHTDGFHSSTVRSYYDLNPDMGIYLSDLYFHINPAIQCAFAVGHEKFIKRIEQYYKLLFWAGSPIMLQTGAGLIRSGRMAKIIAERKKLLQERNVAFAAISKLPTYAENPYAIVNWAKLPDNWKSSAFTQLAYEKGILVRNSDIFLTDEKPAPPYIRISNGAIHRLEDFTNALHQLNALLLEPSFAI